jgi:hypothetical protein
MELRSWALSAWWMCRWSDLAYEAEHDARRGVIVGAYHSAVEAQTALGIAAVYALMFMLGED